MTFQYTSLNYNKLHAIGLNLYEGDVQTYASSALDLDDALVAEDVWPPNLKMFSSH